MTTALEARRSHNLTHDKVTDVAYVDLCEAPEGQRIDVVDVTEVLGITTTVLGRFDEEGNLLGITIENYKQFRRQIMRKYMALAVERIIDLLVDRVKSTFAHHHGSHNLEACAH